MTEFFDSWDSYRIFERSVKERARFVHASDVDKFLQTLLATAARRERTIHQGTILYRARIGYDWRTIGDEDNSGEIPAPFSADQMKPVRERSLDGRASPRGIPVLYVAEEDQTALSEVRPFKGEKVSLAALAVVRDLRVVDCRGDRDPKPNYLFLRMTPEGDSVESFEPPPEEREKVVWEYVDAAFAKPVGPNDSMLDYIPTQIIAELFKQNGYDGIKYRSSLRKGTNVALFDLDSADVCEIALHECSTIAVTCPEEDSQARRRGPAYEQLKIALAKKSKALRS